MSRHKNSQLIIGPLGPKSTGKHFLPEAVVFPSPSRICNAMMPVDPVGIAKACSMKSVRPGADQHAQFRSRGLGC